MSAVKRKYYYLSTDRMNIFHVDIAMYTSIYFRHIDKHLDIFFFSYQYKHDQFVFFMFYYFFLNI